MTPKPNNKTNAGTSTGSVTPVTTVASSGIQTSLLDFLNINQDNNLT
jgi:hypothetical protein